MAWRSSFESQRTFNSDSDLGTIGRTFTSRLKVTNLAVPIDNDEVELEAVEPVELVDEVLRDDRRGRRREAEMEPKGGAAGLFGSEAFRSLVIDDDAPVPSFLSEFWRVYSRLQRRNILASGRGGSSPMLLRGDMVGWELILLDRFMLVTVLWMPSEVVFVSLESDGTQVLDGELYWTSMWTHLAGK